MGDRAQKNGEAFVLHAYPYRETSLLVEVFTRGSGKLMLVARGARRPRSVMRGVLLSFQPLSLSWFGKSEVRTLARAEWVGGQGLPRGEALLCCFYLNELLLRLLPREDPHEALYDSYQEALARLAAAEPSAPILRNFEKSLLKELGYAMVLGREHADGAEIRADRLYVYDPERGPVPANGAGTMQTVLVGKTLLDMSLDDYSDPVTLQQSKALMRFLIDHRLERQGLSSRRIFQDLLQL